jgi:DNA-binding beta-propeller fold protein YncE
VAFRSTSSRVGDGDSRYAESVGPSYEPVEDAPVASSPAPSFPGSFRAAASSEGGLARCPVCLEAIATDAPVCSECGEPLAPPSSSIASIPDVPVGASWFRLHWRPLLTMLSVGSLIASGVALRYLAPERYQPPQPLSAPVVAAAPACDTPCWHGEACHLGRCVWLPPDDAGHLAAGARITGPFDLPRDATDLLPIDDKRIAVASLLGVQILDADSGRVITLVSDAPQAQKLFRVGDVVYATSPKRIFVIDVETTRVLKTIETGNPASELVLGAAGHRVLVSIPASRAVAVIATEYHAEVSRFFFGDDPVGPVAIDDAGEMAFTTNGEVPVAGLPAPNGANRLGAMYAFNPSRLPSHQDQVRTALVGNPVDIEMMPDSRTTYVVLREKDRLVRLERLESGAVRQTDRVATCDGPEQIELVRRGRRAAIRCQLGRALEIFDLTNHELVRRVGFNHRVSDMVVAPDATQAVLALPRHQSGTLALLDLDTFKVAERTLDGEPDRLLLSPDGRMLVVVSNRAKLAWVVR